MPNQRIVIVTNRYDELWASDQNLIDRLVNTLASITSDDREKLAKAIETGIEAIRPKNNASAEDYYYEDDEYEDDK